MAKIILVVRDVQVDVRFAASICGRGASTTALGSFGLLQSDPSFSKHDKQISRNRS